MTQLHIMTAQNAKAGSVKLPLQFAEPVRTDLILRAVLSLQAKRRQPYASNVDAGMRHSSRVSKRRHDYRGSYGKGISRVDRKIHSRRGSQIFWVGAESPGTVGGRRAHAPKTSKIWEQKVNIKENRKAIRSALAATMNKELVSRRGHKLPESFPFLIDDAFESIAKTAQLEEALVALGFAAELDRASDRGIRAGRGKTRGRKLKRRSSILFVTSSKDTKLANAAANLPGTSVVPVEMLNAELLAPGAHPGRLTLFTQGAIARLEKEGLFLTAHRGVTQEKPAKATKPAAAKTPKAAKPAKKAPAKKAVKKA